jgi:hypothetical protein
MRGNGHHSNKEFPFARAREHYGDNYMLRRGPPGGSIALSPPRAHFEKEVVE